MSQSKSLIEPERSDTYEQQYQQRVVKNLKRKAKQMGFDLVPQQAAVELEFLRRR